MKNEAANCSKKATSKATAAAVVAERWSGSADVRTVVVVCRVREWLVEVSKYVYRIERE